MDISLIIFGIIAALFSLLLIVSPFICLYWVHRPPKRFFWRHKFISKIICFGACFGCVFMITRGVYSLLWFIPDDLLLTDLHIGRVGIDATEVLSGWEIKLLVGLLFGVVGPIFLFNKSEEVFREKQRLNREDAISFLKSRYKRELDALDIDAREGMIAKFRREKEELGKLRRDEKINPSREEDLIALEQVLEEWDEQEDS